CARDESAISITFDYW
nr:immunoglobulin heavy chain junction region [Macaca mulatta]MOW86889.1 immunoglobulin heavy chain junction region [Macaca mulatta]MOW86967.1 immunoglobulin heavy chain junction region [Macaca mulatta]MOW87064.1 immunoglobulin heavy chain junction region [Macaca mulatta]MOW87799.1 immunoglobulin heavy chain junction region [Macaca mulatta]